LQRVLRQGEIPKLAGERHQDTPVFFAKGRFDLGRCGHSMPYFGVHNGRISIAPYCAAGIFAAQASASSRSFHSSKK
jgi:hypothetical protein